MSDEGQEEAAEVRFDLDRITRDFREQSPTRWRWLEASYAEPERFLKALLEQHASAHGLSTRTVIGKRYDLFHDLLKRHAGGSAEALRVHQPSGWRSLSYALLWRRACQRAAYFERQGLTPGALLCLLRRPDEGWLTDLCAAFRVGAVVSTIELAGGPYVRHRLAALAPAFLVIEPGYERWVERDEALAAIPRLDPEGRAKDAVLVASGHVYAHGEEALRLFSPLAPDPLLPTSVPAERVYCGAMRDALLAYDLRPGDSIAAPGLALAQHQPALTFAACFTGACTVLVPEEALEADADVAASLSLSTVGLTPRWRRALPTAWMKDKKGRWFSSLNEPFDVAAIQKEAEALEKEGLRGCFVCTNAAYGGAYLALLQPQKAGMPEAAPMPGQAWALSEPGDTGMPATGAGIFLPEGATEDMVGQFLIGSAQGRYYFAGALGWTKGGWRLPKEEIAASAEGDPRVLFASLVMGPARLSNDGRATLLIFAAEGAEEGGFEGELRRRIEVELGPRLLPDQIEIYPLFPRLAEDRPDPSWCRYQYLGGMLNKKRTDPTFRTLGRLGRLLHRLTLAAAEAPAPEPKPNVEENA